MQLLDWTPLGIHIVVNGEHQVALVDDDRNLLVGPMDTRDCMAVSVITEWLFGYLTDSP